MLKFNESVFIPGLEMFIDYDSGRWLAEFVTLL